MADHPDSNSMSRAFSTSARSLLQFVFYIMGELLNLVCLANYRDREHVSVRFIHFHFEVHRKRKQLSAFVGYLLLTRGTGCIEVLRPSFLVALARLRACAGRRVGGCG
jgi:hypothetical protein